MQYKGSHLLININALWERYVGKTEEKQRTEEQKSTIRCKKEIRGDESSVCSLKYLDLRRFVGRGDEEIWRSCVQDFNFRLNEESDLKPLLWSLLDDICSPLIN